MTDTDSASAVLADGYVPVIDLGLHKPPDPVRRRAVVSAVAKACETSGFFAVAGHGIPEETTSRLHQAAREFFGQPGQVKQLSAADPRDPLQRGYYDGNEIEIFTATRLGEPGATGDAVLTCPNRWPDVPGFRDTFLAYYGAISALSLEIMRLLASALQLPADWFDDKFDNHMTMLAINYYPALTEPAQPAAVRHDAHADFGTVTLLHQGEGPGGLQILDREDRWHNVPPIPGTFVVNLGRTMTRWTNDRWPSTVHRVVCPPDQRHRDRVSIAFFFQPNADAVINCIPTCADERSPARHPDITSGDFLISRTRRLYLTYRRRLMQERSAKSDGVELCATGHFDQLHTRHHAISGSPRIDLLGRSLLPCCRFRYALITGDAMTGELPVPIAPVAATEFPAIVFAVDDNYCLPLLVAWQSLRETNPGLAREVPVVVLHEGLGARSAARIEFHARRLGLDVSLVPARLPDLPYNVAFGGARANYLRLAIPDALTGHDRVLYLDADLVIRDDLGPLLRADLRGMPIGAVRDPVNPTYELGQALPGWQALGIPGHREYFNSGVLVIDLPAAARADLFGRAFDMVAEHPQMLRLWDQDALNVAAGDRWLRLPGRWNSVPFSALVRTPWMRYKAASVAPLTDLIAVEDDAAITHYVSPAKPWKGLLPRGPANDLYQRQAAAVLAAEDALGPATLH